MVGEPLELLWTWPFKKVDVTLFRSTTDSGCYSCSATVGLAMTT